MGAYVVAQLVKAMTKKRIQVEGARVLVMGLTFKEDCPDLRNTRVVDIVSELKEYNCLVDVYDPWVVVGDAEEEYSIRPVVSLESGSYDAIVLAVAHRQFREMGVEAIRALTKPASILYDLKYLLPAQDSDLRL
jgi:UDP-N-acetyl-D-galactosamine dehydrogenase